MTSSYLLKDIIISNCDFFCSVFVVESDCEVPKELVSLVHLLLLPEADWHALRAKEKLPKGKLTPEVMPIVIEVLQKRLGDNPTSIVVSNSIVTLA